MAPARYLLLCVLCAGACSAEPGEEAGPFQAEFIHVMEFGPSISGRASFSSFYLNGTTAQRSVEDSSGIVMEMHHGAAVGAPFFEYVTAQGPTWPKSPLEEERGKVIFEGGGPRLTVSLRASAGSGLNTWNGPAGAAPASLRGLIDKLKEVIGQADTRAGEAGVYIRARRLLGRNAEHLRGLGLVRDSGRDEVESHAALFEALRHEGMLIAFERSPVAGNPFDETIASGSSPLRLAIGEEVFEVRYVRAGERPENP
jgi:hypothetical protein